MTRIEALRASIAKWRTNALVRHPRDAQIGSSTCALCTLYLNNHCIGCPVFEVASCFCENTPYVEAWNAHARWSAHPHEVSKGDAFRAAALAEAEFLEELLEGVTSSLQPPTSNPEV